MNAVQYYLECLQGIAEGRKSEALQTHVAIEASNDKISFRDIRQAYQDLGLKYPAIHLDDDTIIGTFQSRIASSPKQDAELRRALKIIGQDRWSNKLQLVAANSKLFPLHAGTTHKKCQILTDSQSLRLTSKPYHGLEQQRIWVMTF